MPAAFHISKTMAYHLFFREESPKKMFAVRTWVMATDLSRRRAMAISGIRLSVNVGTPPKLHPSPEKSLCPQGLKLIKICSHCVGLHRKFMGCSQKDGFALPLILSVLIESFCRINPGVFSIYHNLAGPFGLGTRCRFFALKRRRTGFSTASSYDILDLIIF